MSDYGKTKLYPQDAAFFSSWLKKMDKDVATFFVLSGVSLDSQKIIEAFGVACQVMEIRAKKTEEKVGKIFGKDYKNKLNNPEDIDNLLNELLSSFGKKLPPQDK